VESTWRVLTANAAKFRKASLAESTKKQYTLHGRHWLRFCTVFDIPEEPEEAAAIMFVTFLAQTQKSSSIRSTMSGVKNYWSMRGWAFDTSAWNEYNSVMQGIRRTMKGSPQRKHPVSPEELLLMSEHFSESPFARAIWACIMITWWCMFRKSNTTVNETAPDGVGHCIRRGDVTVNRERWQLHIVVRGSKTNQYGERIHNAYVQGRKGSKLDPVQAWIDHLESNPGIAATAAAFTFMEQGLQKPMRYEDLRVTLKKCFASIGGEATTVSSHSLRRGGATYAYLSGVPQLLLKAHGDWASDCYQDYIELPQAARLACTAKMFDNIEARTPIVMFPSISPLGHTMPLELQDQMHAPDDVAESAPLTPWNAPPATTDAKVRAQTNPVREGAGPTISGTTVTGAIC
jgi:hypothetical protein